MTITWALAVPVIIFIGVIVPLWIGCHYVTIWLRMRTEKTVSPVVNADVEKLHAVAERIEQRLCSLETILDNDAPDWRPK